MGTLIRSFIANGDGESIGIAIANAEIQARQMIVKMEGYFAITQMQITQMPVPIAEARQVIVPGGQQSYVMRFLCLLLVTEVNNPNNSLESHGPNKP